MEVPLSLTAPMLEPGGCPNQAVAGNGDWDVRPCCQANALPHYSLSLEVSRDPTGHLSFTQSLSSSDGGGSSAQGTRAASRAGRQAQTPLCLATPPAPSSPPLHPDLSLQNYPAKGTSGRAHHSWLSTKEGGVAGPSRAPPDSAARRVGDCSAQAVPPIPLKTLTPLAPLSTTTFPTTLPFLTLVSGAMNICACPKFRGI